MLFFRVVTAERKYAYPPGGTIRLEKPGIVRIEAEVESYEPVDELEIVGVAEQYDAQPWLLVGQLDEAAQQVEHVVGGSSELEAVEHPPHVLGSPLDLPLQPRAQ